MSNQKFKVRVVNKIKPDLAQKWFNYDIATSKAAKDGGWVIEDPDLEAKLIANGVVEAPTVKKEDIPPINKPKVEDKKPEPEEKEDM